MQFFQLHPAAEGSDRWRLGVLGKPVKGRPMWLVISTIGGTRIEIPINELAGDVECCSGRDGGQVAVNLISEEQLMRDRAEAARFYRLGEAGRTVPSVGGSDEGAAR